MFKNIIYKNILDNMRDGVMAINLKGSIIAFNPAAESILGLKKEEVLGKTFAEVFFSLEGNDDFNQAILDAIYDSNICHHRVVDFHNKEAIITLSLTTSFLKEKGSKGIENIGIIAVFSDITEIKRLRDKEAQLTEELRNNHDKLQKAYIELEENKRYLESALKKIQVVRIFLTIFIMGIFFSIGFYGWNKKFRIKSEPLEYNRQSSESTEKMNIITVHTQPISSSINLTGRLEPLRVINIVSPFSGKVKRRFFNYGEYVKKGQTLVEMDKSAIELEYRSAKIAYLKARQGLIRLENWRNAPEVRSGNRSVTKAKLFLESVKKNLQETESLFKKGIIPANEYEGAKQQLRNAELDFLAAKEELRSILKKGSSQNVGIARMEVANAYTKLKQLEDQLKKSIIKAPVSGIVIMPYLPKKENTKIIEKGVSFERGEVMVSIGDMQGISIKTFVDEVDIIKIKKGQTVVISGDAFPDIKLKGVVKSISSQAKTTEGQSVPMFEVVVTVDRLTQKQRERLSVGMSANLEIVTYYNPKALLVPISAVVTKGDKHFLRVFDRKQRRVKEVEVVTGITTLNSVEILKGLHAGDQIVI